MLETAELFKEWFKSVDHGFHVKVTKITLLIAISSPPFCWKSIYYSVSFFVLFCTTAYGLSCDQEDFKSPKLLVEALDKIVSVLKVSIFGAMNVVVSSWNAVSIETIINRSRNVGISNSSQALAPTVSGDLFKELNKELSHLWEISPTEYEM